MEKVIMNKLDALGIVETCLSVYPELGVLYPPAWLEKHVHICLVETAAFLTALGVDGDDGRAKIRGFLQDDLGSKLEDARAQMKIAKEDNDFREWAEPHLAELREQASKADRKSERAIINEIDKKSKALRIEFDKEKRA